MKSSGLSIRLTKKKADTRFYSQIAYDKAKNPRELFIHGASPESGITHVAITNYKGDSNITWSKPVTDEEYKADAK